METDEPIYINMNFTNAREQVRFTADYGGQNIVVANETLTQKYGADHSLGDNIVYNETDIREFEFVVNYWNETLGRDLLIEGFTCWEENCFAYDVEEQPLEETARLWSNPDDWPSG